jgi:hypothetical protein
VQEVSIEGNHHTKRTAKTLQALVNSIFLHYSFKPHMPNFVRTNDNARFAALNFDRTIEWRTPEKTDKRSGNQTELTKSLRKGVVLRVHDNASCCANRNLVHTIV